MTVPPDPNSADSGNWEPEPRDATPPEPSSWAAQGPDPSGAYAQGQTAAYGQGASGAYDSGTSATYVATAAPPYSGPAPILVSFPPRARQRRFDTWFRIIFAVPHLVILWALGIATEVVVFIGWFAALFIGELPDWAHTFVTGTLRWQTRVYGYLFLLTDQYPPFSLEDELYPIRLVTARTRLNRLAVLFRLLLLIPAAIVTALATYGLVIAAFFIWLIAVVTGRVPTAVHGAVASIIRYQARFYGYVSMLTGEYPKGLYGDPAPSDGQLESSADPWRLTLPAGAKPLISVFLVLGLALFAVQIVVPIAASGGSPATAFSNAAGLVEIGQAYNKLTSSTVKFENASQACSGQLSCVTGQDRKEAAYLQTFASSVRGADLQGQPATDADKLISETHASAQSLDTLATATTPAQYESDFASTGLQRQLNTVDSDYRKLIHDLTSVS